MPETSARELIHEIGTAARRASRITACASTEKKNAALERIAQALMTRRDVIQAANAVDLANARSEGLSAAFVDRLAVTDRVLDQMVTGVRQIAELADPVGGIENLRPMPSGIRVGRMRVPLGVIAMIYESRPNVTIDAAALAIKSGNAVILRGGHEAIETNRALAAVVSEALADAALPADAVQLIPTTDRAAVGELIRARDYVDVLIPRGGKGLKGYNITAKTGKIAGVAIVDDADDIMLIENGGVLIRMAAADINVYGRDTQGVILMRLESGSRVISVDRVDREPEEPAENEEA